MGGGTKRLFPPCDILVVMTASTGTVRARVDELRVSPVVLAAAIGLAGLLLAAALFAQEPAVHDSLHNFRHVSGITCH